MDFDFKWGSNSSSNKRLLRRFHVQLINFPNHNSCNNYNSHCSNRQQLQRLLLPFSTTPLQRQYQHKHLHLSNLRLHSLQLPQ